MGGGGGYSSQSPNGSNAYDSRPEFLHTFMELQRLHLVSYCQSKKRKTVGSRWQGTLANYNAHLMMLFIEAAEMDIPC